MRAGRPWGEGGGKVGAARRGEGGEKCRREPRVAFQVLLFFRGGSEPRAGSAARAVAALGDAPCLVRRC